MKTIFKQIIDQELPAEKVFENERILAFKDINPCAPVHILIIPKKQISSIQEVEEGDISLVGEIVQVAQELAQEFNIQEGYRLLTNHGSLAGQTVEHLHFHLIGGRKLGALA